VILPEFDAPGLVDVVMLSGARTQMGSIGKRDFQYQQVSLLAVGDRRRCGNQTIATREAGVAVDHASNASDSIEQPNRNQWPKIAVVFTLKNSCVVEQPHDNDSRECDVDQEKDLVCMTTKPERRQTEQETHSDGSDAAHVPVLLFPFLTQSIEVDFYRRISNRVDDGLQSSNPSNVSMKQVESAEAEASQGNEDVVATRE
jgi:hypothetical protein